MIRLAFVMSDLGIGGQSRVLLDILEALDPKVFQVELFHFSGGPFLDDIPSSVKRVQLDLPSRMQHVPFFLLKHLWKPPQLKNAGRFDLAVDFSSYWNGCAAAVNQLNAAKRIVWIHSDLEKKREYEWKYRLAWLLSSSKFKLYDHAICVSKGAADAFARISRFPSEHVSVLPSVINADRLDRLSREAPVFEPDPQKVNLVFLGRLSKVKRCGLMLEEFRKASGLREDLVLYLIGDGPERARLEKQVSGYGLTGAVRFVGAQPNPYPLLSRMDALVLCSAYEGQGIVIQEAKHFGLDLIVSKNLEQYNEDVNGVEDLGAAMRIAGKKEARAPGQPADRTKRLHETLTGIMGLTAEN